MTHPKDEPAPPSGGPLAEVPSREAVVHQPEIEARRASEEELFKQLLLFPFRLMRYELRVLRSRDVRFSWKLRSFLALLYVVSPIDIVPELLLGPLGLFDDLGLTLAVFDSLINQMPAELFDRFWIGGRRVIRKLGAFLDGSFQFVPGAMQRGIRNAIGSPGKGPSSALPGDDPAS
jgi:uncharacterized membrane protein YkvA (DUF1232 family)